MPARSLERLAALINNVSRNTERVAPGDRSAQRSATSPVEIFGMEDFAVVGYVADNVRYGLKFSSSTDNVLIADDASIQEIFAGGGTVEAWIKPTVSAVDILVKGAIWTLSVTGVTGSLCKLTFGHQFSTTHGVWALTTAEVDIGEWTHVVVTYDSDSTSNNPTIIINDNIRTVGYGVTESSTPAGTALTDAGYDLYIGSASTSFDGVIRDVKLWSDTRTPYEMVPRYFDQAQGNETGLVGYWPLEEGGGTKAYDYTSNNNIGVVTGATYTDYKNPITMTVDSSLVHDGGLTNSKSIVTDDAAFQNIFAGGGTVDCWFNANSDGRDDNGAIVSKFAGSGGWIIRTEQQSGSFVRIGFVHRFSLSLSHWYTSLVSINAWHHLAIVYDSDSTANNPSIYIDNVQQSISELTTPSGTAVTDVGANVVIGSTVSTSSDYDGEISHIRIWSTTKSADWLSTFYNKQSYGNETDLVGYWKLTEGGGNTSVDFTSNDNSGTITTPSYSASVPTISSLVPSNIALWQYSRIGSGYARAGESVSGHLAIKGASENTSTSISTTGIWSDGELISQNLANGTLLQFSVAASRPAAGYAGVVHFATDTETISYDDGSAWNEFTPYHTHA